MNEIVNQILKALDLMHPEHSGWVFVPEVRAGTGYRGLSEQRMDAWAIQCWGTGSKSERLYNKRRAFEIKVSESDVRRELLTPDKRWYAYAISNEFYFVAPKGLIDVKRLTRDDGLIQWNGETLHTVKAPRVRESMPPRWDFVASVLRKMKKQQV